jgi:isopenicillin N synthase-like dioxygenase
MDFRQLADGSADVDLLRSACVETGFFLVEHIFENDRILKDVLGQMDQFFSLDDDEPRKKAVRTSVTGTKHGWTPIFGEPAYQPGTVAHLESFDCGRPRVPGMKCPASAWPDLPGFRQSVRSCWRTLADAGDVILESLAEAARIDRRAFADRCSSHELSTMRLLHYPENNAPLAPENVGIAAHTDFECMTMILQTAPGLELRDVGGNWYDAPARPNQVVILIGDMMERWTNGRFQATGHRVRNSRERRCSIVMFVAANDELTVEPLAGFVSADMPPGYDATTQREHLRRQVRQAERNRDLAV